MGDKALDDLLSNLNSQMTNLKSTAPVSHGPCFHCNKPIIGPLAEASGRRYHPEHFLCTGCKKSLHGKEYYEPDDGIYCTECYHKQLPSCAKCGRVITERAVTLSDINKAYHPEHFSCAKCGENLEGKDFYTQNNQPYCTKDYHATFSNSCVSCKKPLKGGDIITTQSKLQYHSACFVCQASGCGKKLGTNPYYEYKGHIYCENHYNNATAVARCPCGQMIQGAHVDALGKKWHPDHFVCTSCNKKLLGERYSETDGKAYCEKCDP